MSHIRPGTWVVVQGPDGERVGTVKEFIGYRVRRLDVEGLPTGEPFRVHRGDIIEQSGLLVRLKGDKHACHIDGFSAASVVVAVPAQTLTITATREQIRPARLADLPAIIRERKENP